MVRLTMKINLTVAMALALVFAGCSHIMNHNRGPSAPAGQQPTAEEKYASEITQLKEVIRQDSASGCAPEACPALLRSQ